VEGSAAGVLAGARSGGQAIERLGNGILEAGERRESSAAQRRYRQSVEWAVVLGTRPNSERWGAGAGRQERKPRLNGASLA
jgi:hypothetical protein